jgi:hypothetical protein
LRHGYSGTHYVTRRSHQMEKHKIALTCPTMLFVESVPVPLSIKNNASTFHAPDAPERTP